MRIISGKYKGRVIKVPTNFRARPTTDFAKENLFNILSHSFGLEGISVLDLFSGTGSIAFEFVSRGAASVTAVEKNFQHSRHLKQTAEKLDIANIQIIKSDAFLFLAKVKKSYDLIFADPPYNMEHIDSLPSKIFNSNLLASDGLFILEHSKDYQFSENPFFNEQRTYGSVNFSFFKAKPSSS